MALSSITSGDASAADDINQYKDHLEGGVGKTITYHLRTTSGQNFTLTLGDADGARKLTILDSGGTEVARIDSNGNVQCDGTLTAGSGSTVLTTAAGLLKHEAGGLEFNASAITTGGIVQGASSGNMEILAIGSSGQVPVVTGGKLAYGSVGATVTEKGSNQTLNSTTLATTMSFTGVASAQYKVAWTVYIDGIDNQDNVQFGINSSNIASCTMAGVVGGGGAVNATTAGLAVVTGSTTTNLIGPNASDTDIGIELLANITMDGSGGTVNLQSALVNDTTGTDTVILADSMQTLLKF